MSKFSQAQIAREGETPLLPDIFIRDMILGMQDTDQIEDMLREQAAERALPEAQLWTILKSLEERGRPDLARFYFGELMKIVNDKQMQMQQQQMQAQQQAAQAEQQAAQAEQQVELQLKQLDMQSKQLDMQGKQMDLEVKKQTLELDKQKAQMELDFMRAKKEED